MLERVMSEADIPEDVAHLIFEKIDSVEQLEVLLMLWAAAPQPRTSEDLSSELRSSVSSVSSRLAALEKAGLVGRDPDKSDTYFFMSESPGLEATVSALSEIYKVRRQKVFQLIFSPLKKGRHFADAFMVTKPIKKGDS